MNLFKDMDENQYWMSIMFMVFLGIVILITATAYNINAEDRYVHDLVKNGEDPIEVACLYKATESLKAPCLLIAQAKAKIYADQAKLTEADIAKIVSSTATE